MEADRLARIRANQRIEHLALERRNQALNTAISIFAALVLLSLLVMIHELGHFLAGRALGFSILEFSIGMGPKLLKKKSKKGTEFSLRAFPIGGMCRFEGEDQEIKNEKLVQRAKGLEAHRRRARRARSQT